MRHDNGDDNHRQQHDEGSDEQHNLAADLIDDQHSWDGSDQEDNSGDTGGEESVGAGGKTERLENVGSVVDDGVDAGPLLEEHDQPSNGDTLTVIWCANTVGVLSELGLYDRAGGLVGEVWVYLSECALLREGLGLDLEIFDLDQLMLDWELAEPCKGLETLLLATDLDQPTWREWHEPDAESENAGWDTLNDGWKSPGHVGLSLAGATDVVGSVTDPEGNHDTENGSELVSLLVYKLEVAESFRLDLLGRKRRGDHASLARKAQRCKVVRRQRRDRHRYQ